MVLGSSSEQDGRADAQALWRRLGILHDRRGALDRHHPAEAQLAPARHADAEALLADLHVGAGAPRARVGAVKREDVHHAVQRVGREPLDVCEGHCTTTNRQLHFRQL
eukprot:705746-Prymnesium_polylepis.1